MKKTKTSIKVCEDCATGAGKRAESVIFLIYALTAAGIAAAGILTSPVYSSESMQRVAAANDLLSGLSRGRQALVGSLRVAPLPTVILSILAAFPLVNAGRALFVVMTAGSTLLMCCHINGFWKAEGLHPAVRTLGGVAVMLLPGVAVSIQSGRSTMIFVALTVSGTGFLLDWLVHKRLRSLAYAGVLLGLSLTVRFQGFYIAAGAFLIVAAAVRGGENKPGQMEGATFIFATPVVYMILLWIGGNWLILGNPFFPFLGIVRSLRLGHTTLPHLLLAGCEWGTLALTAMICLGPVAVGHAFRKADLPALKSCVLGGALVVAAAAATISPPHAANGIECVKTGLAITSLEENYPYSSFIITGYKGYEFSRQAVEDEESVWIHVMHLEQSKLEKILADFEGRNIFLLLHRDELVDNWLDLGIEWGVSGAEIPEQFLFTEKTGPWIVFEVFRPKVFQVSRRHRHSVLRVFFSDCG